MRKTKAKLRLRAKGALPARIINRLVEEETQRKREKNVYRRTFELLRDNAWTRNTDVGLFWLYGIKFHPDLRLPRLPYKAFLLPFASIERARRNIQKTKKLFLPSNPEVRKKRRIKEKIMGGEMYAPC